MKKMISLLLICILLLLFHIDSTNGELYDKSIFIDDFDICKLPNKQWKLHNLSETKTSKIIQLTGEYSLNKTQSRFGVWGTDLGVFTVFDNVTYMFCGDTFSTEQCEGWRSNVLFTIDDQDPSDGLSISNAISDKRGKASEILFSIKQEGIEKTVIPTNMFAANGKLYCFFMSVSKWGAPGEWTCRYSGLAVSNNKGKSWKKLNNIRWSGDSGFIQIANALVGNTVYIWGIPSGRFGGLYLMKVPEAMIEDFSAYSYYCGIDTAGRPIWISENDGIKNADCLLKGPIGEISVIYNEYLGNFIITYLNEYKNAIVLREMITPWGEFSNEWVLAKSIDYPSLYGAFMCPVYVEKNGKSVYFTMSQYFPIYNIMWMRFDLP